MDEQMIVKWAVDKYQILDGVLRSQLLIDEDAAFLRGRKFELMLLICILDEQAIVRLAQSLPGAKPEMVSISKVREINLN